VRIVTHPVGLLAAEMSKTGLRELHLHHHTAAAAKAERGEPGSAFGVDVIGLGRWIRRDCRLHAGREARLPGPAMGDGRKQHVLSDCEGQRRRVSRYPGGESVHACCGRRRHEDGDYHTLPWRQRCRQRTERTIPRWIIGLRRRGNGADLRVGSKGRADVLVVDGDGLGRPGLGRWRSWHRPALRRGLLQPVPGVSRNVPASTCLSLRANSGRRGASCCPRSSGYSIMAAPRRPAAGRAHGKEGQVTAYLPIHSRSRTSASGSAVMAARAPGSRSPARTRAGHLRLLDAGATSNRRGSCADAS
jgi:hypothetical protein